MYSKEVWSGVYISRQLQRKRKVVWKGCMQAIENLSLKQMLVIRADGSLFGGGDVSSAAGGVRVVRVPWEGGGLADGGGEGNAYGSRHDTISYLAENKRWILEI